MTLQEALKKLLVSHSGYYTINEETPAEPFAAEALFTLQNRRYFLLKSAKVSDEESGEIVFFATPELLTKEGLEALSDRAWAEGTSRVRPHGEHKNTDIVLYILTYKMEEGVAEAVRKIRKYQSYRHGLHGFSHFKLVVYDLTSDVTAANRLGSDRKKVIGNTFAH